MTDVVGLRFVNEGLDESLRGLRRHEQAVERSARGMKVVADQSNQSAKSLDRLNRDVLRAENEMRRLAQAMQRGSVTGAQFQGEVNRIAARLRNLGLDRAQAETMRFARAQAELARETQQAGNAIVKQSVQVQAATRGQAQSTMFASRAQNASGMAMQQVGYQVGDFLVQVQSGTNAMVAFGQQATQLVGVLPMFGSVLGVSGTALIGLSAGLGIAIPLITAIGATIMRARENAGDAAEAFKGLGASLDALDNVRLDNLNKGIAEGAREAAREYERVLNLMERVELRALQSILQGQANAVEAMIKNQDTLRNLAAQGGLEFDFEVMGLDTYNEAIFLATQLRTLTGETREELLQQLAAMEEALTLRDAMTPQVEELLAKLAEEVGLVEAAAEASERKLDIFAQEARSYEQAIALQRVSLQFGEDSAAVRRLENQQAQKNLALRLREQGLSEEQVSKLVEMLGVQQQLEGELRASEDAAMGLTDALKEAASAMASLLNVGSLEAKLAGLVAETRAITTGADAASASFVASELAKAAAMRDAALAEGAIPSRIVNQAYEERVGIVSQIGEATTARNAARDAARPGRSGGRGGAAREQEDYLKNLLLEAEHKRRLVGLTEEQTRRQELLFDLEKRKLPIDEERIAQIIAIEAETRKLLEAEARREQLMQSVESNITSAFMSIVDGSASVEDAFRSMMRNILLAVYEQMVAQPAAAGISNLLSGVFGSLTGGLRTQANGGGWNNGVQFFANGGVVGSPTMFGHSGGIGVMGEAGPEAIMPLKRGADGKLGVSAGGGGSLTVNVVMDPSTGALGAFVQDQAGQVVAKAAPQLAQHAAKSMVDQRRRGGSMKAVFRG